MSKKYTYDEVFKEALKYFNNDEIQANVWINKYAMKDNKNNYYELTPKDMHTRMAKEFAIIEERYNQHVISSADYENLSDLGKVYNDTKLTTNKIYNLFKEFGRIIPQGSVMSQLGHKYSVASLSNCTVVDSPFDSYNGIIMSDLELANLMKRRCGVGIDISTLRPAGALVSNAAQTSTGAISFMERFSNTTREVSQNGRRGALMLSCHINFPDIEKFATIKNNGDKVTGANISILLSDEFMEAVENDSDFLHIWPVKTNKSKYKLDELPYNKSVIIKGVHLKKIKARNLWDTIATSARNHAEPGLLFWDRQHKYSTSSLYPKFENVSTNPCAEIGLGPNDSCRLITTNLFKHVDNAFTKNATFNFDKWAETIYYAQILNDDLVDLEIESIERILNKIANDDGPEETKAPERILWEKFKAVGLAGRRTGVGLTGFGDTLAALGIKYGAKESLGFIEKMMKCKAEAEFNASIDMAIIRGKFEDFDADIENTSDFNMMLKDELPNVYTRMLKFGRRNISLSTISPNGTTSLLANNITSGIEPVFMPFYTRRKKINPNDTHARIDYTDTLGDTWQEFNVIHPNLIEWIKLNYDIKEDDIKLLTQKKLVEYFELSPYFNSTAHDVPWMVRVKQQAIFQKYITHSISVTHNFNKDVSVKTIQDVYFAAWKHGLKGITVYRDGSRSGVLVETKDTKESAIDEFFDGYNANFRGLNRIVKVQAPKRPENLECTIHNLTARGQRWTVLVGMLGNDPYEVWAYMNNGEDIKAINGRIHKYKKGGYSLYDTDDKLIVKNMNENMSDEEENLTRQISLSLRTGADMKWVVNSLDKSKGSIVSFAKAIARTLKKYVKLTDTDYLDMDKKCPECGDPKGLVYENACVKCISCGHEKCS